MEVRVERRGAQFFEKTEVVKPRGLHRGDGGALKGIFQEENRTTGKGGRWLRTAKEYARITRKKKSKKRRHEHPKMSK